MAARRGSTAITAADTSAQPSHGSTPTRELGDTSMADTTGADDEAGVQRSAAHSRGTSSSRGNSASNASYIQQVAQLDIAFLHAISAHRPLGPHKHFNLIPILVTLDRTARQVGAGIRDRSASGSGNTQDEGEDSDADGGHNSTSRSRSTSRRVIKREEGGDVEMNDQRRASSASVPPLPIDVSAEMVRERLRELYNVEALEDLENQTVDLDDGSPFVRAPAPSFVSVASRKALGDTLKAVPLAFGFGSSLMKVWQANVEDANASAPLGKKKPKSKAATAAAAAAAAEQEQEDLNAVDFELGPWEEYEELMAQRRVKATNREDDDASESDGELSELDDEMEVEGSEAETGDAQDVDEAEVVGEEGEELEDEGEEEEEEEEEEGEEDEEEEDEDEDEGADGEADEEDAGEEEEDEEAEDTDGADYGRSSSKRKGSAGGARKGAAVTRQKRNGLASTTSSAATARAARTSTVKPRRSGRR